MKTLNEIAQMATDAVIEAGISDKRPEEILSILGDILKTHNFPILRMHVGTKWLHPLSESTTITWHRDHGITNRDRHAHSTEVSVGWQQSPLKRIIDERLREKRFPLINEEDYSEFPLLQDLAANGATEYFATVLPYGESETAFQEGRGAILSFVTDQEGGFTEGHLEVLRRIIPRFILAFKSQIEREVTSNVVTAYLGTSAAEEVLSGSIQRGDGRYINSVLWFSDLRQSSKLAGDLSPEQFLELLNKYFECTAGQILNHGGEVLRFIGDAVLGIFPIEGGISGEARASRMAISAAKAAFKQVEEVNKSEDLPEEITFGLGLHIGEVLYGNIGVPDRLEFSVIGTAANEVARMESHTKEVGASIVASAKFKNATQDEAWQSLGMVKFRGIDEEVPVYSLNP